MRTKRVVADDLGNKGGVPFGTSEARVIVNLDLIARLGITRIKEDPGYPRSRAKGTVVRLGDGHVGSGGWIIGKGSWSGGRGWCRCWCGSRGGGGSRGWCWCWGRGRTTDGKLVYGISLGAVVKIVGNNNNAGIIKDSRG